MKLDDGDLRYNHKEIFYKENGEIKSISFSDAYDIALTFFDAVGKLDKSMEDIFEDISIEFNLDKI